MPKSNKVWIAREIGDEDETEDALFKIAGKTGGILKDRRYECIMTFVFPGPKAAEAFMLKATKVKRVLRAGAP